MRITLLSILILAIALGATSAAAQEDQTAIQPPETIKEAQQFGIQLLQGLPQAMRNVWNEEALPFFQKLWGWAMNVWDTQVFHRIEGQWQKVLSFFGQEIEERKPFIEEAFQREKEELKRELEQKIPEEGRTLWQLIKRFLPHNETE